MDCRTALILILDHVNYMAGACRSSEMVGAVLPKEIIALAWEAIAEEAAQHRVQSDATPPEVSKADSQTA